MIKKTKLTLLIGGFFSIFIVSFLLVIGNTRILADDLLYYTFARHGVTQFITNLKTHYETINGRLFVHAILSILLSFDSLVPIIIANTFILFNTLYFATKLLQKDSVKCNNYLFLFLGFSFLLIGDYLLIDAVFWLSGFFNYVFPLMLFCMYLYFLQHHEKKISYIGAVISAILSSFTTEIYGALTIIFTILYLILCIIKKKKVTLPILCMILSILCLLILFLSPGIQERLIKENEIGFIKRCLVLFTVLSQMTFEKTGLSTIFLLSSLACALASYQLLKNKPLSFSFLFLSFFFLLSLIGWILPAWWCMGLYVLTTLLLVWYSIIWIKQKELGIFECVIGFTTSFGIVCASGVVSHRGLFLPSIFLIAIMARSITLFGLSKTKKMLLILLISTMAFGNAIHFNLHTYPNAKIWDKNFEKIQAYQDGNTIHLENSTDDIYFKASFEYYSYYYLPEFGINHQVTIIQRDNKYYTAVDSNGMIVTDSCIQRNGHYYIPSRVLADYLKAPIDWHYDIATITYQGNQYRFKALTNAVMTKAIGGNSYPTKATLMIVNQKLYLSLEDANALFQTQLTIKENA